MFGKPKNCGSLLRLVRTNPLEYPAPVMQSVGQYMDLCIIPRNEGSIHPDMFTALFHGAPPRFLRCGRSRAGGTADVRPPAPVADTSQPQCFRKGAPFSLKNIVMVRGSFVGMVGERVASAIETSLTTFVLDTRKKRPPFARLVSINKGGRWAN